ncbi:hypothetical protein K443DRAFT_683615 [Laccaria amethystina LaAM-08-1]|uniref:Type 1 phosphatases regulator n=1 Tax=Laccaria amethystina LaAM-08-1 TaxID=1095629 RepID=A0A0C9XEL7_9AGAR|nr:hypothetical protein K443DRAFT_683615 [Laccaria amethystina LaAM-08-1]
MQYTDTHPGPLPAAAPSNGSRTHTLTNGATRDLENEDESEAPRIVGTLKLRGAHSKKKQGKAKVAWDEDVVDNEGCGKKKSKICCIYHKPRRFDESSDESSDSDASDSDCPHGSSAENADLRSHSTLGYAVTNIRGDDAEPNAYEAAPSSGKRRNT